MTGFGPGNGSFLLFLFVRFFGFDFLGASAVAKIVNVACNFGALLWLGYARHVLWQLGLLMAMCNICGAMIGTRVALKEGSVFIRKVFLMVVGAHTKNRPGCVLGLMPFPRETL